MKGDFSRDTFDSKKHYNRVLMQQGRVQADADWNEQQAITAYREETATKDIIGAVRRAGRRLGLWRRDRRQDAHD